MPTNPMATYAVVDTDSHVSEPLDLWTSRLPKKFQEVAPHTEIDRNGEHRWRIGAKWMTAATGFAVAGWKEFPPSHPTTLEEADIAAFDSDRRLEWLDRNGIFAQVQYPNLVGFYGQTFVDQLGPEAATACVQAYNDFMIGWCSADPKRLIPTTALPYWDIEAAVAEIHRCAAKGTPGILFGVNWPAVGLPPVADERWEPIFAACDEADQSVNIHVGFAQFTEEEFRRQLRVESASQFARDASQILLGNARNFADLVGSGVLHRHPDLKFVAVESGCGWLPFLMESLDWQWLNLGAREEFPERELPSFYIKRQIYGTFWYENLGVRTAIEVLPDNIMFETDFPHPISLSPGPASYAKTPLEHAEAAMKGLPEDVIRKVMYGNAARLYKLDQTAADEFVQKVATPV